jgi:hypothetical protein
MAAAPNPDISGLPRPAGLTASEELQQPTPPAAHNNA